MRSASLAGSATSAEMRVEFRNGALGPLEVHAVVNGGSVGAEIHVQGQEAHTLLAASLPALERALGERDLHVSNIAIYQNQSGQEMSGGQRQGQQPGSDPSLRRSALLWDGPHHSSLESATIMESEEFASTANGLSIRV